eukprot:5275861-Pleurochrysis_carterae.AAC.2
MKLCGCENLSKLPKCVNVTKLFRVTDPSKLHRATHVLESRVWGCSVLTDRALRHLQVGDHLWVVLPRDVELSRQHASRENDLVKPTVGKHLKEHASSQDLKERARSRTDRLTRTHAHAHAPKQAHAPKDECTSGRWRAREQESGSGSESESESESESASASEGEGMGRGRKRGGRRREGGMTMGRKGERHGGTQKWASK